MTPLEEATRLVGFIARDLEEVAKDLRVQDLSDGPEMLESAIGDVAQVLRDLNAALALVQDGGDE